MGAVMLDNTFNEPDWEDWEWPKIGPPPPPPPPRVFPHWTYRWSKYFLVPVGMAFVVLGLFIDAVTLNFGEDNSPGSNPGAFGLMLLCAGGILWIYHKHRE